MTGAQMNNQACILTGLIISSMPKRTTNASHRANQTRTTSVATCKTRFWRRERLSKYPRILSITPLTTYAAPKYSSQYTNLHHTLLQQTAALSLSGLLNDFTEDLTGQLDFLFSQGWVHQEHHAGFTQCLSIGKTLRWSPTCIVKSFFKVDL